VASSPSTEQKIGTYVASFGITDVGRKRDHNEDSLLVKDDLGLYVVADGMGGHAAGEVASAKAVEVIRDFVARCQEDDEFTWPYGIDSRLTDLENILVTGIKLANREVWRIAQEKQDHHGMGTTVASLHIRGLEAAVAHVGDSRVYRVSDGVLKPLTEDHSWVNEQLRRGIISEEEAKNHRWKNVITRALGNKEQIEVEVHTFQLKPGDMLMLCSDGLGAGDEVDEKLINQVMMSHGERLHDLGRILISLANEAGGKDNITVVVLKVFGSELEARNAARDTSQDDTNPVVSPKPVDLEKTHEMDAAMVAEGLNNAKKKSSDKNRLTEPIPFEDGGQSDGASDPIFESDPDKLR